MMVSNTGSVLRLLLWQWRNVTAFLVAATLVAVMHQVFHLTWMKLPTPPVLVVGGALGIFVSFRTNSAYDRWWEGRKLWGRMINSSRHWATQVLAYLPAGPDGRPSELQRRLIERHAAYVHVLRCALRQQAPLEDEHVVRNLAEIERAEDGGNSNLNHALLQRQLNDVEQVARDGTLHEYRLQSMDETVRALLDIQGGCERIKKTPMPRGYGFIAERLIFLYGILFPFALTDDLGWMIIPINVLVTLSFALISEAGRVLEDPFTMFYNGLPLSNISLMIEKNLRERMRDTELPEVPGPDANGILM